MFNKTDLKDGLSSFIARVTFEKADGSERVMICTLKPEYLPPAKPLDENVKHVPRKENDAVLAVWDLENEGWRSFNLNSIINIQYIGVDYAASA